MKRKGLLAPLHQFCDFMRSKKVAEFAAYLIVSLILAMFVYGLGVSVLELVTGIKVPGLFKFCPEIIEECREQ